jgi:glycosyltransferase involved in cell wall biosynthesis
MENKCKISIIIPTLNRAVYLENTLESLINQNFPVDQFEILIVDGGSTDNTKDICDRLIKTNPNYSIHYIYEPEPGSLAGRHRGSIEAKGEIFTFIDDDIEASPIWLSSIYDAFRDPSIHLVGGKSKPKFEVNPPIWLKDLWYTTPYGGKACGSLSLLDLGDKIIRVHPNYIWSLNFSIRKKTFFGVGGFNPDIYPKRLQRFQGDGETGLTIKLFEKGYEALYHPDVSVFHIIPANRMTIEYFEKRAYFQGVVDSYTSIRKNGNDKTKDSSHSGNRVRCLLKKYAYKMIKTPMFNMTTYFRSSKDTKMIKEKMKRAYSDGYNFHQIQVKNDPVLLKWILKENYLDYYLQNYTNDTIIDTMEKSY